MPTYWGVSIFRPPRIRAEQELVSVSSRFVAISGVCWSKYGERVYSVVGSVAAEPYLDI